MFACCVVSAVLLFFMPVNTDKSLDNLSQADSLLHLTFRKFNLKKAQIYTTSIRIDSNFTRKNYVISVGAGFPATEFHTALNDRLHFYNIILPAHVIFPEKGMKIQVIYHQTIISTIKLLIKR
jgi:hypothetical protein